MTETGVHDSPVRVVPGAIVPAQRVVRLDAPLELCAAGTGTPRAELVHDAHGAVQIRVVCRCGEELVLACEFEESR